MKHNIQIGICPIIGFGYNTIDNIVNINGIETYRKKTHLIFLPFICILIGHIHNINIKQNE